MRRGLICNTAASGLGDAMAKGLGLLVFTPGLWSSSEYAGLALGRGLTWNTPASGLGDAVAKGLGLLLVMRLSATATGLSLAVVDGD